VSALLPRSREPRPRWTGDVTRGGMVNRRQRSGTTVTPCAETATRELAPRRDEHVAIAYGGRHFMVTADMAERVEAQARRLIENHESELVALLHDDGVELLLIAEAIPFTVGEKFAYRPAMRLSATRR